MKDRKRMEKRKERGRKEGSKLKKKKRREIGRKKPEKLPSILTLPIQGQTTGLGHSSTNEIHSVVGSVFLVFPGPGPSNPFTPTSILTSSNLETYPGIFPCYVSKIHKTCRYGGSY